MYLDQFGLLKLQDLVVDRPSGFPLLDNPIKDFKINDSGQIAGSGGRAGNPSGTLQAYVLTPLD
ncbi:MAG: hypothetical protein WD069_12290 [Planctomycetales bacterium]